MWCVTVVFWNHNCATFYQKIKCRMYGNFVFALSAFFMHISPHPLRGRRGWNAAKLRQAPWPCCFIIFLTVVLRVLKYWTEHEKWWLPSLPSLVVLFKVEDSGSHVSAPGLFRLTPWTITLVKEKEICMFTCDKCTFHTAPAVLPISLSPCYVSYNQKEHKTRAVMLCFRIYLLSMKTFEFWVVVRLLTLNNILWIHNHFMNSKIFLEFLTGPLYEMFPFWCTCLNVL